MTNLTGLAPDRIKPALWREGDDLSSISRLLDFRRRGDFQY